MQMFGNLDTENLEETGDRLGGSTFESGYYKGTVKLVYAGKSQSSKAQSVNVVIDIDGREYKESFWVTNRNDENFYVKNDKKFPLPGFTNADDLAMLTTGYGLAQQEAEEKTVSIYDFETKAEKPTQVMVFTGMLGKEIGVGILKQTVDKNQKDASGNYVPSGETREENVVDKFFHAETERTVTEIKQKIETPVFKDKWLSKNEGRTVNKAKGAGGVQSGAPGRPQPSGGAAPKPANSLFG